MSWATPVNHREAGVHSAATPIHHDVVIVTPKISQLLAHGVKFSISQNTKTGRTVITLFQIKWRGKAGGDECCADEEDGKTDNSWPHDARSQFF